MASGANIECMSHHKIYLIFGKQSHVRLTRTKFKRYVMYCVCGIENIIFLNISNKKVQNSKYKKFTLSLWIKTGFKFKSNKSELLNSNLNWPF